MNSGLFFISWYKHAAVIYLVKPLKNSECFDELWPLEVSNKERIKLLRRSSQLLFLRVSMSLATLACTFNSLFMYFCTKHTQTVYYYLYSTAIVIVSFLSRKRKQPIYFTYLRLQTY